MNLRALLSLLAGMPVGRARRAVPVMVAIAARSSNGFEMESLLQRAGEAFAKDLQPVATAIASALHAENMPALHGLRGLLPGLLREVNKAPSLAVVISRGMIEAILELAPIHAAEGAVRFSEEEVEHDALRQWRSREVFETDLSSAELRDFARHIRDRAIFSARTTNAEYLSEVAHVVDEILGGKLGMAEGRWRLMKKLKQLDYDPVTGFPGDVGAVPPAERDSLQDLSSEQRIDLMLETNVRMAQGYAQVTAGLGEYALYAYPAWELVRLYHRNTRRGTPESNSPGWTPRWNDAGSSVDWEGAQGPIEIGARMVALKTSPIWDALGDGAGGYTDTLLNAFPPFAFRSGFAWRPVPRAETAEIDLQLDQHPPREKPTLTPPRQEVDRVFDGLPEDLRLELLREIEAEENQQKGAA